MSRAEQTCVSIVAVVTFCMGTARNAHATDYYVAAGGNDAGPGSKDQPWGSIDQVDKTSFAAGDAIYFAGGATFQGTLTLGSDDHGSASKPIVISSYGAGRAIIDGGNGGAFVAQDSAGIELRSLIFKGSGMSSNSAVGVLWNHGGATALPYIRMDSVEVSGFKLPGISLVGPFSDVRITHVDAHDNAQSGMETYGKLRQVYVGSSSFHDNPGIAEKTDNHSGSGLLIGAGADDVTLEYNIAYNNGALCNHVGGGPVGIWTYASNKVVIQFNESHHNHTGARSVDGGGFDLDGGATNCVMQYNYAHDNDGAGFLVGDYAGSDPTRDNVVRYNISENDGRAHGYAGIYVYAGSALQVLHNTIFTSPTGGNPKAVWITGGTDLSVRNNLLITEGQVPLVDSVSGVTFQGNEYDARGTFVIRAGGTAYHDLAAFRAGAQQERVSGKDVGLSVDPLLSSVGNGGTIGDTTKLGALAAYRLRDASPMIGAGVDLAKLGVDPGPRDFFGHRVVSSAPLDVGAYQTGDLLADGGGAPEGGVSGEPPREAGSEAGETPRGAGGSGGSGGGTTASSPSTGGRDGSGGASSSAAGAPPHGASSNDAQDDSQGCSCATVRSPEVPRVALLWGAMLGLLGALLGRRCATRKNVVTSVAPLPRFSTTRRSE